MSNPSDSPARGYTPYPPLPVAADPAQFRKAPAAPPPPPVPESWREPAEPVVPDADLPASPQHITADQRARLDAHGFDPADFHWEPVHRRFRRDGWTVEAQRSFIAVLADTGSVDQAAHAVAMSARSAYALRRSPGAEGFAHAWATALDAAAQRLADVAFDRALNGVEEAVRNRDGDIIGTRRRYNDRLLMFLLRAHQPGTYARLRAPAAQPPASAFPPAFPGALPESAAHWPAPSASAHHAAHLPPASDPQPLLDDGTPDAALMLELQQFDASRILRQGGDLVETSVNIIPPPPPPPLQSLGRFIAGQDAGDAGAGRPGHPCAGTPAAAIGRLADAVARLGPVPPADPLAAMDADARADLIRRLEEDAREDARLAARLAQATPDPIQQGEPPDAL